MSEQQYEEAKRRQHVAEALIAVFTPQQKSSFDAFIADDTFRSPYDWPGWADIDGFQDPREGWSS